MYTPYFIACRLRRAPQKAFTSTVYKIGIVSVALSLATTLIAFLVMQGFQKSITQKLTSFCGHLQVTKYSLNRSYEAPPLEKCKLQRLQHTFPEAIQMTQAFAYKTILFKSSEEIEGVVCKGLEPEAMHKNLIPHLKKGRIIDFPSQGYSQELVLSTQIARRLNVQVDDEVIAYVVQQPPRHRKLRVVGLYETHIAELDEKLAFCDLRLIQRLNNWSESWVGGYEIFLHAPQQITSTLEQLLTYLDYDLRIKSTASEYAGIFDWLAVVRKHATIFMILILLVASSNVVSIVLIQTMERAPMIRILKTLGASFGQVQQTLLWNQLYMVGQGMLWGNLVGIGLCCLQHYSRLISLNPTYYYIDHVPIAWNWRLILGLNVLSLTVVTTALMLALVVIVRSRPIKIVHVD